MSDRCQAYLYATELDSVRHTVASARDEAAAARANADGNSEKLDRIAEQLNNLEILIIEVRGELASTKPEPNVTERHEDPAES